MDAAPGGAPRRRAPGAPGPRRRPADARGPARVPRRDPQRVVRRRHPLRVPSGPAAAAARARRAAPGHRGRAGALHRPPGRRARRRGVRAGPDRRGAAAQLRHPAPRDRRRRGRAGAPGARRRRPDRRALALRDPAHIEALARERLGYARPGEMPYRVELPGDANAPRDPRDAGSGPSCRPPRPTCPGTPASPAPPSARPRERRGTGTRGEDRPTAQDPARRPRGRARGRTDRPAPAGPAPGRPPLPVRAPDVVETAPRLEDGTPFPTLYYATCPRLTSRIGTLEADGLMREQTERLETDAEFAAALRAAPTRPTSPSATPSSRSGTEVSAGRHARAREVPARPRRPHPRPRAGGEPVRRRGPRAPRPVVDAGPCVGAPPTARADGNHPDGLTPRRSTGRRTRGGSVPISGTHRGAGIPAGWTRTPARSRPPSRFDRHACRTAGWSYRFPRPVQCGGADGPSHTGYRARAGPPHGGLAGPPAARPPGGPLPPGRPATGPDARAEEFPATPPPAERPRPR